MLTFNCETNDFLVVNCEPHLKPERELILLLAALDHNYNIFPLTIQSALWETSLNAKKHGISRLCLVLFVLAMPHISTLDSWSVAPRPGPLSPENNSCLSILDIVKVR